MGNSKSKPCLDARGESMKIADALDLVIGKLDAKMIFESCEQLKRLQAVDSELLVEIITGLESGAWNLEMCRRKIQDFLSCLLDRFHDDPYSIVSHQYEAMADTDGLRYFRQNCAGPA